MLTSRSSILHGIVLMLFGSVIVATPTPLDLLAFIAWAYVVLRWASRRPRHDPRPGPGRVCLIQAIGMAAIVIGAALAPVKTEDRVKARQITLPKQAMTLAELSEPVEHGLDRFCYCYVSVPAGQADHTVRFASRELTIDEFIAAIETQTPLRYRFAHCGNGSTILWGGDCSFGLHFRAPAG